MMTPVTRYPWQLRVLHWLIALLILGMIGFGWYLSEMDYENPMLPMLRQWHRTVGLCLFPLGLLNLWAYTVLPRPPFPATMPARQQLLARLVHSVLLYVVIAIPVAGYFMSGDKLVIVGDITVPAWVVFPKAVRSALFEVHETLAWTTLVLALLHAAAAIKHHVVDKDDTLKKMKPF